MTFAYKYTYTYIHMYSHVYKLLCCGPCAHVGNVDTYMHGCDDVYTAITCSDIICLQSSEPVKMPSQQDYGIQWIA